MEYGLPETLHTEERPAQRRLARLRNKLLNIGILTVLLVLISAPVMLLLMLLQVDIHPFILAMLVGGCSLLVILVGIRQIR